MPVLAVLRLLHLPALIGCCRQTAANRLQNIGGMTINDLLALGRGLDIPIDTLRAAIKYQ